MGESCQMLIASTTLHMLGSCHRLSFWKQMLRCSLMHSVYYRFLRQEDEVSALAERGIKPCEPLF